MIDLRKTALSVRRPDGYDMLMSPMPNKGETGVHGCHCWGDMVLRMRKVMAIPRSCILDPSAYGFGNAPWEVSSRKLCAGVAKIWLFGPHSECSLIQPKLFASFISTSSRKSCAASVLELKKFS